MGILTILLAILISSWLFYNSLIWIPLHIFDVLGQVFWWLMATILLMFFAWCFKD